MGLAQGPPYDAYDEMDFDIPIGKTGDYALSGAGEMRQSLRIIEQAIDGMPAGPVMAQNNKIIPQTRGEMKQSMEALIIILSCIPKAFMQRASYTAVEAPGKLVCIWCQTEQTSPPL